MKSYLTFFLLLGLAVAASHAEVVDFYAPGGVFDQTVPITLTQTGNVYIEAGGTIASTSQGPAGATIWVDGVEVTFSNHSVTDASQTAVVAIWAVVLSAGSHTIEASVTAPEGYASNTFFYIDMMDEPGAYDQEEVTDITNAYEAADTELQSQMTTLIQNAETDLQNQINTTDGNVTELQQQLATLTQQVSTMQANQSTDEAAIAQLQEQITEDEASITSLLGQVSDLESQLQNLSNLEQANIASLQTQVQSLSGQVTGLGSTAASKSSLDTDSYLLYGAGALGAGALGFGIYDTFFNQPSTDTSPTTSDDPDSFTPITVTPPTQ